MHIPVVKMYFAEVQLEHVMMRKKFAKERRGKNNATYIRSIIQCEAVRSLLQPNS